MDWTSPLPRVRVPTSTARPWRRSAPATISAAEAVRAFTSTIIGTPGSVPSGWAENDCRRPRRSIFVRITPPRRKRLATLKPISRRPPGLSRRSITSPRAPGALRSARRTRSVVSATNSRIRTKAIRSSAASQWSHGPSGARRQPVTVSRGNRRGSSS